MGTFTAVGIETEVRGGTIRIVREGKYKKFIGKCSRISFVASEFLKKGSSLLYITERCVIRRTREGMILEEVGSGDRYTDTDYRSMRSRSDPSGGGPKLMDASLFTEDGFSLCR